jgi:hypothetical protein
MESSQYSFTTAFVGLCATRVFYLMSNACIDRLIEINLLYARFHKQGSDLP